MNQDNKSRNLFTLIIVVLFLVFSYYIIKSYFKDDTPSNTYVSGSFSFVYNNKQIDDKLMYDETRTVKVVKNKNYTASTNDVKSDLFIKLSKVNYYFDNVKLSIDSNYLDVYQIDNNVIRLVVLGNDLRYYSINVSILKNGEEVDISDKTWKSLGKSQLSVYPAQYYKVINDKYSLYVEYPFLLSKEKYPEKEYNKLISRVEKSIKIEDIDNSNYYFTYNSDIKLDDKITLKIKDLKLNTYSQELRDNYSLTKLVYYNQNNELITINEIDNLDKYLETVNVAGEHNYKDLSVKVLDNNTLIINNYLINYDRSVSDLDSFINGVLEIKE
ncbi:MAG: hypothetical protein IKP98_00385 [Bacilli bacterium]|nr:hypothetical protein [Bacilli bacterium]